jgi:3-deoxy-D-manno-octulosonic acid kinase
VSGQKWPLGSEVRRKDLTGGVMLYDASRAGNAAAGWFDPEYWKERNEVEGEARGRGTTHFVRSGKQQFVLRHYRRGGLVAKAMGDRYFWRNESTTRSFAEWQLLYHLHRAGLPVPAPIAARYRRHGPFYTADIITERLTDSMSLAAQLRMRGIPILGWITIGRCIRAFHDLGVCHPDLNAHNILLVGDDSVFLIDFDRGSLRKPGLWCDANLVRLRRSLEKITYKLPPEHFGEADWHGLLDGYRQSGGMPGAPRKQTAATAETSASSLNRALSVAAASAAALVPASPSAPEVTAGSPPAVASAVQTPANPAAPARVAPSPASAPAPVGTEAPHAASSPATVPANAAASPERGSITVLADSPKAVPQSAPTA